MSRTTKFKAGDLVLIEVRTKPSERSLFKIKEVRVARQLEDRLYLISADGHRYGVGYEYGALLSDEEDKVLTDPAEIAYWLLKYEQYNE